MVVDWAVSLLWMLMVFRMLDRRHECQQQHAHSTNVVYTESLQYLFLHQLVHQLRIGCPARVLDGHGPSPCDLDGFWNDEGACLLHTVDETPRIRRRHGFVLVFLSSIYGCDF